MKLGVFFIGNPRSGGLYQYSLSILDSLTKRSDNLVIFNLSGTDFPRDQHEGLFKLSNLFQLICFLKGVVIKVYNGFNRAKVTQAVAGTWHEQPHRQHSRTKGMANFLRPIDQFLLRILLKLNRIDLLIFTSPSQLPAQLKIPYIMPVHDLQHRLNPQFPEVSTGGVWEEREKLYSSTIPYAEAILVDSETGKEDVLNLYQIDGEKVYVLPFVAPNYLKEDYTEEELCKFRVKYNLPIKFLFYPSNFWPHKNHKSIIKALYQIKEDYREEIPIVFTGSKRVHSSVFDSIYKLAEEYGLKDQVYYLGYVSAGDIASLYKLADALVMPTFFGPTNIPYMEAFTLGCAVIGSDIRGVKEQIGDAGLLVEPSSPAQLADAILKIWNDASLRETLIKRGFEKIKGWNFNNFSETLNQIIDEVEERLGKQR